jgi:TonB family protein
MRVEVADDEKVSNIAELQGLDPNLIHTVNVDKTIGVIYIALKKDGANFDYLAEKSKMAGDVFTVVERQPESQGGINGFRSYIAKEIKYPLEARQAGIEGRVDVQFVVEKDGSLSEVKAIKGIGAGCDEEAVRVLANAPRFKPGSQNGKPVRVRMVVPITFKLDETKTNQDNSAHGIIIIEDVQSRNEKFKVDADYINGEWSGAVYDEQGNALPGATIIVVGTTNGTQSRLDGTFKLKAEPSQELNLSFIGYESVRLRGK